MSDTAVRTVGDLTVRDLDRGATIAYQLGSERFTGLIVRANPLSRGRWRLTMRPHDVDHEWDETVTLDTPCEVLP